MARRYCSILGCLAAAIVVASSCSSNAADDSATVAATLNPVPCHSEYSPPDTVECFDLVTDRDRESSDRDTVTLRVARIASTARVPAQAPVLYLHGGPGDGVVDRIEGFLNSPVLATHDLILIDQRGASGSTPDLDCPERHVAFRAALSTTEWSEQLDLLDDAVATCRDRLQSEVGSLDGFGTAQNVADLEDLRVALDAPAWNLWGESYGTTLALEYAETHPDRVSAMVLDSLAPPGASPTDPAELGRSPDITLFNDCATDPECNSNFPDLATRWSSFVDGLDANPYVFTHTDDGGSSSEVTVDGNVASGALFLAFYDTSLIPSLPLVISNLADGERDTLPFFADVGLPFAETQNDGGLLSTACADNQERIDPESVERLREDPGRAAIPLLLGWQLFCGSWDVESEALTPVDPGNLSMPTLVLAGEYDPITPSARAQAFAEQMDDAEFVEVGQAGHVPGRTVACLDDRIAAYFLSPGPVDQSCLALHLDQGFSTT